MRRHILDALIIGAAVGLGASSLYAQAVAGRAAVYANSVGGATSSAVHRVAGPNGGTVLRPTYQGQTTYQKGTGLTHTETCTNASGAVVSCGK